MKTAGTMDRPKRRNKLQLSIFGTRDRRLLDEIRTLRRHLAPVIESRLPGGVINLIFTNNRHITELNRRFLGRDRPTDVLAFPLPPPPQTEPRTRPVIGEIYISREQAQIQARAAGVRLHTELLTLVRHGLLHLAGFSHDEMDRLP